MSRCMYLFFQNKNKLLLLMICAAFVLQNCRLKYYNMVVVVVVVVVVLFLDDDDEGDGEGEDDEEKTKKTRLDLLQHNCNILSRRKSL